MSETDGSTPGWKFPTRDGETPIHIAWYQKCDFPALLDVARCPDSDGSWPTGWLRPRVASQPEEELESMVSTAAEIFIHQHQDSYPDPASPEYF